LGVIDDNKIQYIGNNIVTPITAVIAHGNTLYNIFLTIFIPIPFASLKAQNGMKTVVFKPIFFYKYIIEIAGNYKPRGGECAASLGADRIFICVDCPFKHK